MLCRALALALFLTAGTIGGFAQVQLGAVRLGYALDEVEFGLRPLIGTPGSAYLGGLVPLPFPVRQAAVRGDTAVVIAGEPGALTAFRLSGLQRDAITHHQLAPAGRLWLNDSGTLALLQKESEVRLVSGLSAEPEIGPAVAVDGLGAVTFVPDRRCAVLASNIDSGGVRLESLCAERPGELIWLRTIDAARSTAIAYTRDAGLFLTDTNSRRILRIPAPIATEPVQAVAEEVDDPLALVAISDSEVLAARKGVANLLLLSAAAGAPGVMELPAAPDRLDLLAASRLIACSGAGDFDPLLVIDLLQDRSPFFIPILRSLP